MEGAAHVKTIHSPIPRPLTSNRVTLLSSIDVRPLRVQTLGRCDAAVAPGGGEVQQVETGKALQKLGVDVRPWNGHFDATDDCDVLHLFGSRPEFVPIVAEARRRGIRTALSTIAWFDWRNPWREPGSLVRRSMNGLRYALRAVCPKIPSWRQRLYQSADVLLPNSQAEAEQLRRLFQVCTTRIRVVPNGVCERLATATPELFRSRYGLSDFVLCCGRLEPRKNQLSLIRALRSSRRPLVLLGAVVPGHEAYYAACRAAADERVHFLGSLPAGDPLVASAYAAAACLALVSWYETPGLAALEAAAAGVPIVVPQCEATREYFGRHAEYVPPYDLRRIREAVESSIARGRRSELAELVQRNYTWHHAAAVTREAYVNCN